MLFLTGCVSAARLPSVLVVGFLAVVPHRPTYSAVGPRPSHLASLLCPHWDNTSLTLNRPLMVGDRLDALHMTTNSASMTFGPGEQDDRCPLGSKPTEPVIKEARRDDL